LSMKTTQPVGIPVQTSLTGEDLIDKSVRFNRELNGVPFELTGKFIVNHPEEGKMCVFIELNDMNGESPTVETYALSQQEVDRIQKAPKEESVDWVMR